MHNMSSLHTQYVISMYTTCDIYMHNMHTQYKLCIHWTYTACNLHHGWALFAKSESPTKILKFLGNVFPELESCPDFVCIDKACLVVKTVTQNPEWEYWLETS